MNKSERHSVHSYAIASMELDLAGKLCGTTCPAPFEQLVRVFAGDYINAQHLSAEFDTQELD